MWHVYSHHNSWICVHNWSQWIHHMRFQTFVSSLWYGGGQVVVWEVSGFIFHHTNLPFTHLICSNLWHWCRPPQWASTRYSKESVPFYWVCIPGKVVKLPNFWARSTYMHWGHERCSQGRSFSYDMVLERWVWCLYEAPTLPFPRGTWMLLWGDGNKFAQHHRYMINL